MKHLSTSNVGPHQAGSRLVPEDWMRGRSNAAARPASGAPRSDSRKWMTTLPAALPEVRDATLSALAQMNATLAYLYEAQHKVVVRSTLPGRQIRTELTRLHDDTTRIVVVSMQGSAVDRSTSGEVIQAIERTLAQTDMTA